MLLTATFPLVLALANLVRVAATELGRERVRTTRSLAFTRYSFTSSLLCMNQSSFYCPSHYCNTIARLLYNIRPPPPTTLLCATNHTILVMAILCKGQPVAL